jgi:hypothetical protein
MDPITAAILAALSAGVITGAGKVAENALVDAYNGLKATLKRKFGDDSEVVEAVDKLEGDPESEGRKLTLKEEVEKAGVDQDPEVQQAAQELLDRVKQQPGGEKYVQQYARGTGIAQAEGGSTATVDDVNQPNDRLDQRKD